MSSLAHSLAMLAQPAWYQPGDGLWQGAQPARTSIRAQQHSQPSTSTGGVTCMESETGMPKKSEKKLPGASRVRL